MYKCNICGRDFESEFAGFFAQPICQNCYNKDKKPKAYCTQNDGDCKTCSLVNYGKDCQNKPTHGGLRPGAGRKSDGIARKPRAIRLSDAEYVKVKKFLESIRK